VGWDVGEDERDPLPGRHREVANRGHPLAPQLNWRAKMEHIWPGNREEVAVFGTRDPGCPTAIAEPNYELRAHRHCAALADHQADETRLRPPLAHRHKVHQNGRAAIGGSELGFENQRVASVATLDPKFRLPSNSRRGDLPTAIVGVSQERCKTSRRVEPWPTKPVDGAIL